MTMPPKAPRHQSPALRHASPAFSLLLALLVAPACAPLGGPHPTPALSPAEVVRLQVQALGEQGLGGIAVTYRFASPSNRRAIGSYEQFIDVVRSPSYAPMLGHFRAEYGELQTDGRRASGLVLITDRQGGRHAYLFRLSRQRGGPFSGCWMTDSVHLVGRDQPDDAGLEV